MPGLRPPTACDAICDQTCFSILCPNQRMYKRNASWLWFWCQPVNRQYGWPIEEACPLALIPTITYLLTSSLQTETSSTCRAVEDWQYLQCTFIAEGSGLDPIADWKWDEDSIMYISQMFLPSTFDFHGDIFYFNTDSSIVNISIRMCARYNLSPNIV